VLIEEATLDNVHHRREITGTIEEAGKMCLILTLGFSLQVFASATREKMNSRTAGNT
jgi:hypothetical protein